MFLKMYGLECLEFKISSEGGSVTAEGAASSAPSNVDPRFLEQQTLIDNILSNSM
jgi:hypothetical protein